MRSSAIGYRPDIDGIRAIAILAVVGFHTSPEVVTGGFVGVDVFFVISGYLISNILLDLLQRDKFSLIDFYLHRARRIFPALSLVLAVCLIFGWLVLFANEYRQLGSHATAGALFYANFAFWDEVGYFDVRSDLKPLLHLWSLGIEEQFYIFWPLFLWAAWKRKSSLLKTIGVMALASFVLGVALTNRHSSAAFYMPLSRAWELLIGCGLAYVHMFRLQETRRVLPRMFFSTSFSPSAWSRISDLAAILGMVLIVIAITRFDKSGTFPGWRALIPTLGTALLIAAGPGATFNRLILGSRGMVLVGLISYPLYLWHWPLLSLSRILESGNPSLKVRIAAVVLAFGLACVTYLAVERPIRSRPARSVAPWLFALMSLLAISGYFIAKNEGFPVRLYEYEERLAFIKWSMESETDCSEAVPVNSRYCRIANSRLPPTVAVIGDSHANRLFDGLSTRFVMRGANLLQLGEGGCLPFWNVQGGQAGSTDVCMARMNGQLDYVVNLTTIKTVILSSRGPLYISGLGFGDVEKNTRTFLQYAPRQTGPSLSYGDVFSLAMRDTLTRLLAANKKVVFVIDNPELGFDPLSCIQLRPFQLSNQTRVPCAVSRSVVDARNLEYRKLLESIGNDFPSVGFIDMQAALCDEKYCWAFKDGTLLYMDGDHLNKNGVDLVARHFSKELFR